jgi:hypothetical protein
MRACQVPISRHLVRKSSTEEMRVVGSNLPNRRHSSRFACHPPRIRNQPVWVVRVIAVYVRSAV